MGRERMPGERGSIAPVFLVVLAFLLLLGWTLAGATASHSLQAARRSRDIVAGELAQAGLEAAIALIDEGGVPPERLDRPEGTGEYAVTITPTGRGTYVVESVGTARERQRGIRAEVAPPPEPFALLAGGDVNLSYWNAVNLGGEMRVVGDINAHGSVSLTIGNAVLSLGTLRVAGDVRAGEDVYIAAENDLLGSSARTVVEGGVGANGDIRLTTDAGLLLTAAGIVVEGPVTYGGSLDHEREGLLGSHDVRLNGPVVPGGGVTLPEGAPERADAAFYEALVADLEAAGQMRRVTPDQGCGTIARHTRVTGNIDNCANLTVESGVVLVVDGRLDASTAEVQGLVYVRGGATPSPGGDVDVGTLSLLDVARPLHPAAGGGGLVATGNIAVDAGRLIKLLSVGPDQEGVLQVLALSTGDDDLRNDLSFGIAEVADVASAGVSPQLFLYTGGAGTLRVTAAEAVGAIDFQTLPLVAVSGGDIEINVSGLADVVSDLTLEARADIWQQVPPFLQGMGRARLLSWEWMS